jgi:subtilisin family serine protease
MGERSGGRSRVAARFLSSTALRLCFAAAAGPAAAQTVGINQHYNNQYGLALIGAGAAYTAGYTGQGVIIAVGDSGVATTQPPFAGKIDPRSRNYLLVRPGDAYDVNQLGPLSPMDSHSRRCGWPGAATCANTTLVTQAALLDTPFEVDAAAPGRDAALVDLSITAWRSDRFRLFDSLSGEFRRNAISHRLRAASAIRGDAAR